MVHDPKDNDKDSLALWKVSIFPVSVAGMTLLASFFNQYFWGYVISTLLLHLFPISLAVTAIVDNNHYYRKIPVLLICIGIFSVLIYGGFYKVLLDIPYHMKDQYRTVEGLGVVEHKSSPIKIDGTKYLNKKYNLRHISRNDEWKEYKIHYLPHSKYVIKLWIYDD